MLSAGLPRHLRTPLAVALAAALALITGPVQVATAKPKTKTVAKLPASVRAPERLTAGEADQFLGMVGPDERTLYFVSNRNATAQVFRQTLPSGTPTLLFSDAADVSWPRPSPDGKKLLYISTRDDATGDVCTRALDGTDRRCLTDATSAENQAFWFPNGDVGIVTRRGLHGDLQLRRLSGRGRGRAMVDRNLGSPTVSPSGQWLVYVPLERRSAKVGVSFAMKLGQGLHMRRLDRTGGELVKVRFDLPGTTGFPAFSADGRYLYFSQHLSDTNRDGHIDGDDNSVLFRVPFQAGARQPIAADRLEQLTSAHWNCQYPAPARHRLIATCLQRGSLDIYALPLDGAVPHGWGPAKLREALDSARDPWERLLLLDHLRKRSTTAAGQVDLLRQMSEQHLRLGELSSTGWYADRAAVVAIRDKTVQRWAAVMRVWVQHRRDERKLDRGELDDRFVSSQQAHLQRLSQLSRGASLDVRVLCDALRGEILDVIGREAEALRVLRKLDVKQMTDPVALMTVAERVPDRLLSLQSKDAALHLLATLAEHKRLSDTTRLAIAERFTELLLRGLKHAQRAAALATWRKGRGEESHLGFRLNLESILLTLQPSNQESVRAAVFMLYRHSRELPRRRALVSATVRRAAAADNAFLLYQFSNSWASWIRRDHAERDHAVAVYRQVVLERAYLHWSKREYADARASFYGVTLQEDDLEAWIGFFETRAREGKKDVVATATRRFGKDSDHPVLRFLRAYEGAWTLTSLRDPDQRVRVITEAETELRAATAAMPQSPQIYHLRGYLAHQRLLTTGAHGAAIVAHAHYLMALDLARGNPRVLATLLHALGMLQAAVGNHHIALEYLDQRARLPMMRPTQALSLRLARAQSLAHIGEVARAAKTARAAVVFVDQTPPLEHLLPLALDRAALWSWANGDHVEAVALHRRLQRLDGGRRPASVARAHIIAAAAALGAGTPVAALQALAAFDALADGLSNDDLSAELPAHAPGLRWHVADLRAIADGLRAQALVNHHKPADALLALSRRRAALQRRADGGEVESWRLLAACWHHIATLHQGAHDPARALAALESGLAAARRYQKETGTVAPDARLALLLAWARLAVHDANAAKPELVGDLRDVYRFLSRFGHPATARLRATLGVHLTQLGLPTGQPRHDSGETATRSAP